MTIASENRKMELVESAYAQTIAVTHSLDIAFNNGKAKIMQDWVDNMIGDILKQVKTTTAKQANKPIISDRTWEFLQGLPQFRKEET
jgi:hypothetical protein